MRLLYRGYKTYRHYLNYQLHALSAVICGDDTVIDSELASRGLDSVKSLSLSEARSLCKQLTEVAKNVSHNTDKLKQAIGLGKMTSNQRRAIIKVTKYIFYWSSESTMSFIFTMFPGYRKRLSPWEIQNGKLIPLYGLLTSKDADKIIKRLDQIQKRNKQSAVNSPQSVPSSEGVGGGLMTNDNTGNIEVTQQITDHKQQTDNTPLSN